MAGLAAFLLDVLLLGVSCFLHLVGVELEEVGDDFGFGRVVRKARRVCSFHPTTLCRNVI